MNMYEYNNMRIEVCMYKYMYVCIYVYINGFVFLILS